MPTPRTGFDPLSFCADAATVVALRTVKIAQGGPAGTAEARLMVSEKLEALAHVQLKLLSGGFGLTVSSMTQGVLEHYARGCQPTGSA